MSAKHTAYRHPAFTMYGPTLTEMREEAQRLGISTSALAQRVWLIARDSIRSIPSDCEPVQTPRGE